MHKLLPLRDRPVERVSYEAGSCTAAELLAAIIGGPTPLETTRNLLSHFRTNELKTAHVDEIAKVPGIGHRVAARIKAAIELGLRFAQTSGDDRPMITTPSDAADLLIHKMSAYEQEHLCVLLLDTRNRLVDTVEIYKGSVNCTQLRTAEVLRPAVQRLIPSIIVVHNHPSGDPTPSPDDLAVTKCIVGAGKVLDIDVLDHLIIAGGKYVSFKDRGLL